MAGETKFLEFAEGVTVSAPAQNHIRAGQIASFASDSAFAASKGTLEAGDIYINTTSKKIRFYDGTTWSDIADYEHDSSLSDVALGKIRAIVRDEVGASIIQNLDTSSSFIRFASGATEASVVHGIDASSGCGIVFLVNSTSSSVTLKHDSGSATGKKMYFTSLQDFQLEKGAFCTLVYDSSAFSGAGGWVLSSGAGGSGGAGGALGSSSADAFSFIEKQIPNAKPSSDYIALDSFCGSRIAMTNRTNISSSTTTVCIANPTNVVDQMNATTGWSASAGSTSVDTTNFIGGGASVRHTVTSLSGSASISKTFSSFSCDYGQLFCVSAFVSTKTNLSNIFVTLESSAGNSATWNIPASGINENNWTHIAIDPWQDSPSSSAGTLNRLSIAKVYLGMTTSAPQNLFVSWDYATVEDRIDISNEHFVVYDSNNTEILRVGSRVGASMTDRTTYNIAPTTSSYEKMSVITKSNVARTATSGLFDETLAGAAALRQHSIFSADFYPKTNANLTAAVLWNDASFPVLSFPDTNKIALYTKFDASSFFASGDKIVLFPVTRNGSETVCVYNSTIGDCYAIYTVYSASFSGTTTTITTNETLPSLSGEFVVMRLSCGLSYVVDSRNSNASLVGLTPSKIFGKFSGVHVFADNFDRETGPTPYFGLAGEWSLVRHYINETLDSNYEHRVRDGVAHFALNNGRQQRIGHYTNVRIQDSMEFFFQYRSSGITNATNEMSRGRQVGITFGCNFGDGDGAGKGLFFGLRTYRLQMDSNHDTKIIVDSVGNTTNLSYLHSAFLGTTAGEAIYNFRARISGKILRIKCWRPDLQEPAAWTTEYNFSSVSLPGRFFGLMAAVYAESGENVNTHYAKIDNFRVSSADGVIVCNNYSVPAVSGSRLVLACELSRSSTLSCPAVFSAFGEVK